MDMNCFTWFPDFWALGHSSGLESWRLQDRSYGLIDITRLHLSGARKYKMEDFIHLMEEFDAMFKRKHYWSDTSDVQKILRACLTVKSLITLYKDNPKYFDFETLSSEQRALLIKEDYNTFKDAIDPQKLPLVYRVDLFISKPKIFKKFVSFEKVTKKDFEKIARMRPSYFVKYNLPLERLNCHTWAKLIGYKKSFVPEFFDRISNVRNKTDLRHFFVKRPEMLINLTPQIMKDAVLTAKEWILLLNWADIKRQGDFCYTDECSEWLEQELSVAVLSGISTNTRYVKAARERL